MPDRALIDAHVHLHDCFSTPAFLGAARDVFRAASARLGIAAAPGVLLLTEGAGEDAFVRLAEGAGETGPGGWEVRRTAEERSLVAGRDGVDELVLVAGRQIATGDGLEVLAPATRRRFRDGRPLVETLEEVREAGGPAVVPWGFGKWWGRRGRLLAGLVDAADPGWFFLGDNGGRPRGVPALGLFRQAAARGVRVLPGSDPLPFPGHAARAGSYGFVLERPLDSERPAASLLAALADPATRPRPYGRRRSPLPFVVDQLRMQLRKRRGGRR